MKALLGVLMVLLSFSAIYASEIQEYRAEGVIHGTTLFENVSITIRNTQDVYLVEFTYPFDPDVRDVRVYDASGPVDSKTEYKTGKAYVSFKFRNPIPPGEEATITYQFQRPSAVSVYGESYILSVTHSLLANVKTFVFTLQFPEGYGLPQEGVNVVPKPDGVRSDGRRVIIDWNIQEPIPPDFREFRVSVRYEKLIRELPSYGVLALGVATGILVLFLVYRLFSLYQGLKGRREEKTDITEKIDILKEDEQAILKMIIEDDGIEQKKIQEKTGFSKAKVSKIVSELEKRGAVRKEQIGRKNRLYLAEKLKET